jgi:AMP-activated protein kinase-like protein
MADGDPLEQLIQQTRAVVNMRPAPDLVSAVMGRIEQLGAEPKTPSRSWIAGCGRVLWTPRLVTFKFRPAYGLVAAAAVVMLAALSPRLWGTADPSRLVAATEAPHERVYVQFRLQAADAAEVRLAGSFTHWQPDYELHQTSPGLWTVTLPLAPGVHDYAFIVDGRRWVTDPYAPSVQDGFGGTNSRITLIAGGDRRL